VKSKLVDLIDPSRPLAKAARELDWTEVVNLFPEATRDGMAAGKIWMLASMIILSEVAGLSENEVLSRWPENPYWQSFSGLEHFQWVVPVTQADCLNFKRHLTAERAARLTAIAKSIREAKAVGNPIEGVKVLETVGSSADSTVALRQLHFFQPGPAQPYKAPPRPDFHSSIKQTYAKSAAVVKKQDDAASGASVQAPKDGALSSDAAVALVSAAVGVASASTGALGDGIVPSPASAESPSEATDSAKVAEAAVPVFAQTYALPRRMTVVQTPVMSAPVTLAVAPNPIVKPSAQESSPKAKTQLEGTPRFDSTTPVVIRAVVNEPVKMEVNVQGLQPLQYQWESWDDAKGLAIPIEGCTESSLTLALEPSDAMLAFQCRVSNVACPEGVVSKTFFLKKVAVAPVAGTSFGEKLDPSQVKPKVIPGRV